MIDLLAAIITFATLLGVIFVIASARAAHEDGRPVLIAPFLDAWFQVLWVVACLRAMLPDGKPRAEIEADFKQVQTEAKKDSQ